MIEVKDLRKSYGSLPVLRGIDLSIARGELAAIVGPSGAGKSTLLQIMGALDRPDAGEVRFEGRSIFQLSDSELATFRNKNIGFVFQQHHLLPEFTAEENVLLPAMIAGKITPEKRQYAAQLFELLGVSARKEHKPAALSGGEQQRFAVARALINQPSVILADEPSGNLDTHNARELHELFLKLRSEFKQTIVVVTHNMALAELADRRISLVDGKWDDAL